MRIVLATARHTWRWSLRLAVLLLLLTALAAGVLRLALMFAGDYRAALEHTVSETTDLPIRFAAVELEWSGWSPRLALRGLELRDPRAPDSVLLAAAEAHATLDLPRSLWGGRPYLANIRVHRLELGLEQGTDGALRLLPQALGRPPLPLEGLLSAVASIRALDLDEARLRLYTADGRFTPVQFEGLRASLRGAHGRHRLDLALRLPAGYGGELRGRAEWQGERDLSVWQGSFYLASDALELARLPGLPGLPPFLAGRADIQLWGDWQGLRLQRLDGRLRLDQLGDGGGPLRAEFRGQVQESGWQLAGRLEPGGQAPAARWRLQKTPGASGEWRLEAAGLRLEPLATLASRVPRLGEAVTALQPRGALQELGLRYRPADGALALTARLSGLRLAPWETVPGLAGLDAALRWDGADGRIELDGQRLRLDYPRLFRDPLDFGRLAGVITVQRRSEGWRLASEGLEVTNPDLQGVLRGSVALPTDDPSPRLDLVADYHDLAVERARHYLPARIMGEKLVAWLDRALVSGRGVAGQMVLRGRAADFPFDHDEGLFQASLRLEDAILDYFPQWPRIEQLLAEIVFHNRSFSVRAVDGRILDATLVQVQGGIADLEHGVLELAGQVRGPGAGLLRFVQESPLERRLGPQLAGLRVEGDNRLDLHLTIPFNADPVRVRGRIGFDGGNVTVVPGELRLEAVEGAVDFDQDGLRAEELTLRLAGQPARLSIDAAEDDAPRFSLHGRFSAEELLRGLAPGLAGRLPQGVASGRGDWEVTLRLPEAGRNGAERFTLELRSALQGIALSLPPPLAKAAAERRELGLRLEVSAGQRALLALNYGGELRGLLEFDGDRLKPQLRRGELRLGRGAALLPQRPGLRVLARVPRYAWEGAGGATAWSGGDFTWLSEADILIDELLLAGQRFPAVHLLAEGGADGLALTLDGPALAGRIRLPAQPEQPLAVQLQRLALQRREAEPREGPALAAQLDPQSWPPLRMEIAQLSLDGAGQSLDAQGEWLAGAGQQHARLQARLRTDSLEHTLTALGYTVGLQGGATELELDADWIGALVRPDPATLEGTLKVRIGKGQLQEIEPGVGRMLGLFSLTSLPRRLRLDFSDLFQEGLAFDRIEGRLRLQDGQAWTDDLQLDGPAARIDIRGRIGLLAYDYDQFITVTPKISASLPIAGAIAGGPAVGAVLLLAERALQDPINAMASYQYRLTGTRDQPKLERLQSETPRSGGDPDRR
ncbi:MAG TPA: AsmA-like C-terminal region-containing protein [Candidatus Competibacteraceae bacterium]|nr:AsmA-like C-terminal region-containing protein [Candidatus Competibacteraceae bacterium]